MERKRFFSARNIAYFAVLLALVVVLQTCGGFFKIGATSLSFVLVPIVLGGILLGPLAGGLLGFAFGFIVLMYGVSGADPFTAILVTNHPFLTTLVCIVKGTAAGIASGFAYKLLAKKNALAGVIVASALAPIVNTGLFILGALTMSGTISANFVAADSTLVYFLFIGCAGINFLIEFAINLVLSPAIHRVVIVVEKQFIKKKVSEKTTDKTDGELNEVHIEQNPLLSETGEELHEIAEEPISLQDASAQLSEVEQAKELLADNQEKAPVRQKEN